MRLGDRNAVVPVFPGRRNIDRLHIAARVAAIERHPHGAGLARISRCRRVSCGEHQPLAQGAGGGQRHFHIGDHRRDAGQSRIEINPVFACLEGTHGRRLADMEADDADRIAGAHHVGAGRSEARKRAKAKS